MRLGRALRKPPQYVVRRAAQEVRRELDRWLAPGRLRRFDNASLLVALGCTSIDELWGRLLAYPYPFAASELDRQTYDETTSGDSKRVLEFADRALLHRVDLLGSGPVDLGPQIDWSLDYKTGLRFSAGFFRDIDYARLDEPCDVKFPWEVSRLQWLVPAGQAYLLTGDERFASGCREVLEQWLEANPCGQTVNWACTMEAAMRVFTWTWLFHACGRSRAWDNARFRERFLICLYLHADFTERYIERSDVNGNHFTADAAALVFAGLFFGGSRIAGRWLNVGWEELCAEIDRQVYPDGVDFEASVPYHRLVQELFLLPALYRRASDLSIPSHYSRRLHDMAQFTSAYSRADGTSPRWGDNDNARVLPFGGQSADDHRYLVQIAAYLLGDEALASGVGGDNVELYWTMGSRVAEARNTARVAQRRVASTAFRDGGIFIMRNSVDHVFISCGPLGLAGRGGHSHNDLLSFDATLEGIPLVTDSGCYLYTASPEERNRFRSTAYHSTPMVDDEEINRFIGPEFLWNLHNDARPDVRCWNTGSDKDEFCGAHTGYSRLPEPVTVVRRIVLDHCTHALRILDEFEGRGIHRISIPYHISPDILVEQHSDRLFQLRSRERLFRLQWDSESPWSASIQNGRAAPSYGVTTARSVVVFSYNGPIPQVLDVTITRFEH